MFPTYLIANECYNSYGDEEDQQRDQLAKRSHVGGLNKLRDP